MASDGKPNSVATPHNIATVYEGWVMKKRSKRLQGWAKRWLKLDATGLLSYYSQPGSSCRGTLKVADAVINVNQKKRSIDIDSDTSLMHIRALTEKDYFTLVKHLQAWDPNHIFVTAQDLTGKEFPPTTKNQLETTLPDILSPPQFVSHTRTSSLSEASVLAVPNGKPVDKTVEKALDSMVLDTSPPLLFGAKELASAMKLVSSDFDNAKNQLIALGRAMEGISDVNVVTLQQKSYTNILKLQHSLQETLRTMQDMAVALDWTIRDANRNRSLLGMPAVAQPGDDVSKMVNTLSKRPSIFAPSSLGEDEFYDALEFVETPPVSEDERDDLESEEETQPLKITDYEWKRTRERSSSRLSTLQESTALSIVRRRALPTNGSPESPVSIASILRKNMGKDLSTISMPVTLNEPISALQRLAEELEYSDLLAKAAKSTNPMERIVLIAAFAVSGYTATLLRAGRKPFNPLLGETFELIREDKQLRFVAEKVSHNPPILAFAAESLHGDLFFVQHEFQVKSKFWGKSMEVIPSGSPVHIGFPQLGELYSFNKVTTVMRNVIAGTKYLEHVGDLRVTCSMLKTPGTPSSSQPYSVLLSFKESGYFSSSKNEISGAVLDAKNKEVLKLSGRWDEQLCQSQPGNSDKLEVVWKAQPWPTNTKEQFGLTGFAIELNEMLPGMENVLPKTDTRKRPDQRAFENGDIELAEKLKLELEQKQRERRKVMEDSGETWSPHWFDKRNALPGMSWTYNGSYWLSRENKFNGKNIPAIFQ